MTVKLLGNTGDVPISHWIGLNIDSKPTTGGFGSTFYETDTKDGFIYSAAGWGYDPITALKKALASLGVTTALPAGEAHIGEVGRWSDLIVVTPVIAAAAFSAKDFVGGKLTLAGAVRVAEGKGKVTGLKLVDAAKQNADLLVFIFGADLAGTYSDNAAESITTADWLKWIGTIKILSADYEVMANASVVDMGFEMPIKAAAGTTLYALIVTKGTPTYTENCLQLIFGVGEGS